MSTTPNTAAIDTTEFRQAWRILLLAMLGIAINANASMLYAFGSLVIPLQSAFGWQRGEMQFAMSFLFGGAVVSSQIVGWLNLRYGMRRVTVCSLLALSATFAMMTTMGRSIGWLYLFFALLPIASMGTMQVTWTQLTNVWYERNRGLALALILSGTGISAALLPPAVNAAVERWGWQAAFLLLALVPALIVLPLTLRWMKTPDGATGASARQAAVAAEARREGVLFRDGIRMPKYWFLNISLVLVVGAIVGMVTSTIPMLRDKGLPAADAARVFGSFGLSLIGGRVIVGYLIDRLWAPAVAAVTLALPALGCLLFITTGPTELSMLVLASMLIGVGAGAEFDIAAFLVARYFGLRDYGRLFGLHLSLITLGSALSPLLFGRLFQTTGSYSAMLHICGGAFFIGALLLLPLGRYPKPQPFWQESPCL
jgi:MFS family permease